MNNTEEAERLCKKCGKRLPSSNNFCMYCGYNNNLSDAELEALKGINANNIHTQKKQELLNKSINATDREVVIEKEKHFKIVSPEEQARITLYKHQHSTFLNKLIYIFIILDVILIFGILLVKNDGLLYEKFNVKLDNYEQVINIDNKSFLGLKDNKIEVIGNNSDLSTSDFKDINNETVIGMSEFKPASNIVFIETNKKIYTMTSDIGFLTNKTSYEFKGKKIDETSDNFFKDVNTKYYNRISKNGDYYNILEDNSYYIIKDSLYKNVIDSTEDEIDWYLRTKKDKKNNQPLKKTYRNVKVLERLNVRNPEVVDISTSGKSVIIKGNDIIKVYTEGKLIQSFNSITFRNKKHPLTDFKYILYKNGTFTFVFPNGASILYYHDRDSSDLISDAEYYGPTSIKFKELHKNEIDKDIKVFENKSSLSLSSFSYKDNWKAIAILVAAVVIMISVIYRYRESTFIISSLINSGLIFTYILLLCLYSVSKSKEPAYFEAVKSALTLLPIDVVIGVMLGQIKEVVSYLSDKYNIETVYHFVLLLIGVTCTVLAVSNFTNNLLLLVPLPGILWIFMADNSEEFKIYDFDLMMIIKIFGILFISIIFYFIVCYILNICQYYLYVLLVAFSISCFLVLNDDISFMTCFKKFINANITLFITFGAVIVYGFVSIMTIDQKYGEEIVKELSDYYLKGTVLTSLIEIAIICVASLICAIVLFILSKATRSLMDKITDNRILKIFVYMIIMCVICTVIVLSIPYLNQLYMYIAKTLFGDKISIFNFSNLFGSL